MFWLMIVLSVVPLGLGIAIHIMFGKTRISQSLFYFMLLISFWQLDVAVLYGFPYLGHSVTEWAFRLLRFGSIFLSSSLLYVSYVIHHELVETSRVSSLWSWVYSKPVIAGFFLYGLFSYTVGWTDKGVDSLYRVDSGQGIPSLFPKYGPWAWAVWTGVLLFFISLALCYKTTRNVANPHIRSFLKLFTGTCLVAYVIANFNMTPVTGLYPSSIAVLFFALAVFMGFCITHVKVVQEKEAQLQGQHTFLRSIIDLNPNYMYAKDREGKYLLVNQSFAGLWGMEPHELVGRKEEEWRKSEEMAEVRKKEQSLMDGSISRLSLEEPFTAQDGTVRWMQTSKLPLVRQMDGQEWLLCVSTDVTERRKTEELLRTSEKLSMAGELAAGIAHEIRNPLTSIRGFVQLMQRQANIVQKGYLDIMLSEMDRINLIVNEFLLLSKPQVIRFHRKSLKDIILKVVVLLESQANMNNISIKALFDSGEWEIECEENQIKQVFVNLIKNGMESMQDGGELLVEVQTVEPAHVRIRFRDQGCGITPELLQKLGQPFYTTKEKGTGLGLMVSFRIIETHQGTITFQSELGKGTTIDVVLPLAAGTAVGAGVSGQAETG